MKVEFNPVVNFVGDREVTDKASLEVDDSAKIPEQKSDEFVNSKKESPKKFRNAVGDVWKFFSVFGTMSVAVVKGLLYSVVTGAGILAVSTVINTPKSLRSGLKLSQIISHPIKNAGTAGKIIAGVSGAIVFVSNLVKGKLEANQNTADIDHKLKIGHRN